MAQPTPSYLTALREGIIATFSTEELTTLCSDLGVDYESLGGAGKEGKARELVAYVVRHDELASLIEYCARKRPRYPWPQDPGSASQGTAKSGNALPSQAIGAPPVGSGATTRHLHQQLTELLGRYETLSRRIAALDTDIGRELDSERKLVLQERRADLEKERDQVLAQLEKIELQLGGVQISAPQVISTDPPDGQTDVPRDLTTIRIQFDRPMDPAGHSLSQKGGFGLGNPVVHYDPASRTFSFTRDNPGLLPAKATITFTVNPEGEPGAGFVDLEGVPAKTCRFSFTTGAEPTDEGWIAAQERVSLGRQLAELRENLRLIEERKSEYVLATDVPLSLIKEYNRTLAQIKDLEERISRLK